MAASAVGSLALVMALLVVQPTTAAVAAALELSAAVHALCTSIMMEGAPVLSERISAAKDLGMAAVAAEEEDGHSRVAHRRSAGHDVALTFSLLSRTGPHFSFADVLSGPSRSPYSQESPRKAVTKLALNLENE